MDVAFPMLSPLPSLSAPRGRAARGASWGFTVVELITTIILLGILSSVAISVMVSPSRFGPEVFVQQLNQDFHLAHGLATSRQDVSVSFDLALQANTWRLQTITSADGAVRTTSLDAFNLDIQVTSGSTSGSISTTDVLTVHFNGTGDVAGATFAGLSLDPADGVQLDLVGDSNRVLCIYPTGYLHHAACT